MMKSSLKTLLLLSLFFLASCAHRGASLDSLADTSGQALVRESIQAHGGIDAWRESGALNFRWTYHLSDIAKVVDTVQIVDPVSMSAVHRVPDSNKQFGYAGGKYWATPDALDFTPPPRFWTLTPIYFLGIPFVFEDEKASFQVLPENISFKGKDYTQVKITYDKSAGDSPDDYYVLLIDPESKLTRAAYYTVTSPLVNKTGKVVEKLITLDMLQSVNGLKLAGGHETYSMNGGEIGEKVRYTEVSEVKFLPRNQVDFSIPEGARVLGE